jgi:hypothetical protein
MVHHHNHKPILNSDRSHHQFTKHQPPPPPPGNDQRDDVIEVRWLDIYIYKDGQVFLELTLPNKKGSYENLRDILEPSSVMEKL